METRVLLLNFNDKILRSGFAPDSRVMRETIPFEKSHITSKKGINVVQISVHVASL